MPTVSPCSVLRISPLLVVTFLSAPADAKTPDLETPSMETVCDIYSGAAFGACNAYCEAMDCHLDEPKASARACENKRRRFVALTGDAPPCELSCPCLAMPEFVDVLDAQTGDSLTCEELGEAGVRVHRTNEDESIESIFLIAFPMGGGTCGYLEGDFQMSVPVDEGLTDSCLAAFDDLIADQDLVCEDQTPRPRERELSDIDRGALVPVVDFKNPRRKSMQERLGPSAHLGEGH